MQLFSKKLYLFIQEFFYLKGPLFLPGDSSKSEFFVGKISGNAFFGVEDDDDNDDIDDDDDEDVDDCRASRHISITVASQRIYSISTGKS